MITANVHPRRGKDQPAGRVISNSVAQLALADGVNILGSADDPDFRRYLIALADEARILAAELAARQMDALDEGGVPR